MDMEVIAAHKLRNNLFPIQTFPLVQGFLSTKQPVAPGSFDVFLWLMSDQTDEINSEYPHPPRTQSEKETAEHFPL